jgi:hypothetical protein
MNTSDIHRYIWQGYCISIWHNMYTHKMTTWSYDINRIDGTFPGKPPQHVCEALDMYIKNGGYADVSVDEYLNKLFCQYDQT